jgi:DNA replication factor GINS
MDIDELLLILEKSREGKIQPIDDDFYKKLNGRIKELEAIKKRTDDYQEAFRIDDELKTLRRIQRRIFEIRTSKILRAAWAEVCKTESGVEGFENLIEREKNLFKEITAIITKFKNWVFSTEPIKDGIEEKGSEYTVVRVKKDIEEFEGIDGKTYKLRREDVVTLPSLNAKVLVKSGTVEIIETGFVQK